MRPLKLCQHCPDIYLGLKVFVPIVGDLWMGMCCDYDLCTGLVRGKNKGFLSKEKAGHNTMHYAASIDNRSMYPSIRSS